MNLMYVEPPHCVECANKGQLPERIDIENITQTQAAVVQFFDGRGRFHYHDSNQTTSTLRCSHGHGWVVVRTGTPCASCVNPQDGPAVALGFDRRYAVLDAETGNVMGLLACVTGEGRMMLPLVPVPAGAIALAIEP